MPLYQRGAELMQRESLITNPEERRDLQLMINQIGKNRFTIYYNKHIFLDKVF